MQRVKYLQTTCKFSDDYYYTQANEVWERVYGSLHISGLFVWFVLLSLIEVPLMNTHNVCFCREIRKYQYFRIENCILSRAMAKTVLTVFVSPSLFLQLLSDFI